MRRRKRAEAGRLVGGAPGDGERALMRAVLVDALRCIAGQVGAGAYQVQLASEARAWVASNDDEWPFSFVNICHWLEVPAERLRARAFAMEVPSGARPAARRQALLAVRNQRIRALNAAGWKAAALASEFGIGTARVAQICGRGAAA